MRMCSCRWLKLCSRLSASAGSTNVANECVRSLGTAPKNHQFRKEEYAEIDRTALEVAFRLAFAQGKDRMRMAVTKAALKKQFLKATLFFYWQFPLLICGIIELHLYLALRALRFSMRAKSKLRLRPLRPCHVGCLSDVGPLTLSASNSVNWYVRTNIPAYSSSSLQHVWPSCVKTLTIVAYGAPRRD